MDISYINEDLVIMWPEAVADSGQYDIKNVVSKLLEIRTAEDVLKFILDTPPSFFRQVIIKTHGDWIDAMDCCTDIKPDARIRGSMVGLVEKRYPEIEILDGLVVKSGELGEFVENYCISNSEQRGSVYIDVIRCPKPHYFLSISFVEELALNVQALAKIGAVANGEALLDGLRKIQLDCDVKVQAVDSGLSAGADLNRLPVQNPTPDSYFTKKEIAKIEESLKTYQDSGMYWKMRDGRTPGIVFLYPAEMSERDIAANMFISFMNSLFETDSSSIYTDNAFKVELTSDGFRVVDNPSPIRDTYRQIANLVSEKNIRLCSYCGHPILTDRSRGNAARYCSRSCNTKASVRRKEAAYALAASGIPLEDAIQRIGNSYEQSIRRWYKESKEVI